MPELPDQKTRELASEIRKYYVDNIKKEGFEQTQSQLLDIVNSSDMRHIGHGVECVVVDSNSTDSNTVIAMDYLGVRAPREAKNIFYTHRIFSTLFPHNFPHFYSSFAGDSTRDDKPSGTIREKIVVNPKSDIIIYPFRDAMRKINQLNLPIYLDDVHCNFIIGEDGGQYYTDKINIRFDRNFDQKTMRKINEFMETENYSERDIEIVRNSVKRLSELNVIETQPPTSSRWTNAFNRLFGKQRQPRNS